MNWLSGKQNLNKAMIDLMKKKTIKRCRCVVITKKIRKKLIEFHSSLSPVIHLINLQEVKYTHINLRKQSNKKTSLAPRKSESKRPHPHYDLLPQSKIDSNFSWKNETKLSKEKNQIQTPFLLNSLFLSPNKSSKNAIKYRKKKRN